MTDRTTTRRSFLIGAGALCVGAAAGVAAAPFAGSADLLRPPGSLPERRFAARCIRCQRCISACPTDILKPAGIELGLLEVRTPVVDFSNGSCTFCDKCRECCPTQAIERIDPFRPEDGRIGIAVIHENRCLAFLQPRSCGVCVDACSYGALSFNEDRCPVVDENLCNGCGECVRICPANVFGSFNGGASRGVEVVTERSYSNGRRR